jgi:hypothetical protein
MVGCMAAYGTENPWFVRAKASRAGRIQAGGIERGVTVEDSTPDARAAIDAAYHVKYDRYGPVIVGSLVGSHAHRTPSASCRRTERDRPFGLLADQQAGRSPRHGPSTGVIQPCR